MRIYELARDLDESSQEIIRLLNQELDKNVKSHMSAIDESTARIVREYYENETFSTFADREQVKSFFGRTMDTLAFGIGLGFLMMPDRGDETRQKIREEIRDLGKEITEPIKVGGEEIIDLLSVLPAQLNAFKNQALETGAEQFEQISPFVKGAVDEARDLIDRSELSGATTNGEASPNNRKTDR